MFLRRDRTWVQRINCSRMTFLPVVMKNELASADENVEVFQSLLVELSFVEVFRGAWCDLREDGLLIHLFPFIVVIWKH